MLSGALTYFGAVEKCSLNTPFLAVRGSDRFFRDESDLVPVLNDLGEDRRPIKEVPQLIF